MIFGSCVLPLASTVLLIPNFSLLQCQISLINQVVNLFKTFLACLCEGEQSDTDLQVLNEMQESISYILKWPLSRISLFRIPPTYISEGNCLVLLLSLCFQPLLSNCYETHKDYFKPHGQKTGKLAKRSLFLLAQQRLQ